MKRWRASAFAAAVVGWCALTASSQPPGGQGGPGGKRGGPPGFAPGTVIPPFVRDYLDLTAEQEKRLDELEAEVKQNLERILTDEQKKKLADLRPPMGKDGPPPKGRGPGDKNGPSPNKDGGEHPRAAAIQWFTTWEAGEAEAGRTGRPILFVSAAPHCAGVSGIW
ncbi:MAG TPA: hypothetical protein VKE40_24015 [Gemmataceae bacterium]|nr:hypothetical protein [Gemmataceae bacterium]